MQPDPIAAPNNRPKYPPISINEKSPYHLFVFENTPTDSTASAVSLSEDLKALYASINEEHSKNIITIGGDSVLDDGISRVTFEKLSLLLADLSPNTSLYLQGSEAFMWDIHVLAIQQGMVDEQIQMLAPVTHKRRLFCTHCYTITEDVTHSPVVCSGCQRNLLVRDHFSRLHAAYVGLQIDAEDPADLPEPEELS
jgi:hypothetical protein